MLHTKCPAPQTPGRPDEIENVKRFLGVDIVTVGQSQELSRYHAGSELEFSEGRRLATRLGREGILIVRVVSASCQVLQDGQSIRIVAPGIAF